uniref:Uncharacterized protein n=2 Tax=cellular organisms TaxID=131567 RepID=A0A7C4RYS0_FERPE
MGTRCLFKIYDFDEKIISVIYHQFDGYPDGVPLDVAKFIAKRKLVNGIGDDWKVFNGVHDLVAQLITFLKLRHAMITSEVLKAFSKLGENIEDVVIAGEVYVMPADTVDAWQDYEYHIKPSESGKIIIEAYYTGRGVDEAELIFKGTAEEYVKTYSEKAVIEVY